MTKALSTLVGIGVAAVLIWAASQIHRDSTGGYWGEIAVLASAGLVVGIARLPGSGANGSLRLAPGTLVVGFLPALVAGGWVLLAAQPNRGWLERHVSAWSGDVGVGSIAGDLGFYAPVIAFSLGLTLGLVVERRAAAPALAPADARPARATEPADVDAVAQEADVRSEEPTVVGHSNGR